MTNYINGMDAISSLSFNRDLGRVAGSGVTEIAKDGVYEIVDRRFDLRHFSVRDGVETPLTEGRAIRVVLDAAGRDPETKKRRDAQFSRPRRDQRIRRALADACLSVLPRAANGTDVFVKFGRGDTQFRREKTRLGRYSGAFKDWTKRGWDYHLTVDRDRYVAAIAAIGSTLAGELVVLDAKPETDGLGGLVDGGVWTVTGIRPARGGGEIVQRFVVPDEGAPWCWPCAGTERGARAKVKIRRAELDAEAARSAKIRELEKPSSQGVDDAALADFTL